MFRSPVHLLPALAPELLATLAGVQLVSDSADTRGRSQDPLH